MFKGHPKGLIGAALANMGERFGFYTMMAILVLFLQSKFGLNGKDAGLIYSIFYFSIYILAFVGGLIADKLRNFKGVILTGLIVMALGYVIMAVPTPVPEGNKTAFLFISIIGLFVIAFGNGLFKGNLQALVGQMYDKEMSDDTTKRDSGFSLFYMFINVGAIFAPFAAIIVRNWWLGKSGLGYDANLPALCHAQIDKELLPTRVVGTGVLDHAQASVEKVFVLDPISQFQALAQKVSENFSIADFDPQQFAHHYLDVFNTGFHYAFATAIAAMAISLVIYLFNLKTFPSVNKTNDEDASGATKQKVEMSAKEIKQRLYALFAVFGVVIFFWFSFHQNGLTLTMFARDYTVLSGIKINLGFTTIEGAEIFQSINPIFIVLLTPIIMGVFGWLKNKGKEISTPRKIAIGMGIAGSAYVVMALGSAGLPLHSDIAGSPLTDAQKVTPLLLIGTYLILTIAELFISPLGISFVSKVAPPKYQGIMQGGWLGATAVGNQLLFIGAILYESIPIWMTWSVFVIATSISMFTMLFMVKWLERITK